MKEQKKRILVVSTMVAAEIFLLVAALLVLRGINNSEAELDLARKKWHELYDQKPFPSHKNIAQEKANVSLLNKWFVELTTSMRKGQIEPVQKSPSNFMSLLYDNREVLINQANAAGKVVAKTFGFGFERYFANSAMPEPSDVPRLTQQFMIVSNLCGILFSEKIDALTAIKREEFEAGASDAAVAGREPSAGRGAFPGHAGVLGEEDLYAKFHFILQLRANEKVLWDILNKLSSHEMFIVVTGVEVAKAVSDLAEIKTRSAASSAEQAEGAEKTAGEKVKSVASSLKALQERKSKHMTKAPPAAVEAIPQKKVVGQLPREERVVCAPNLEKPLNITIEVDVYRFRGE